MSKKKLVGIVVACIIGIFIVIAIAVPSEPTPTPTPPPTTEITFEPIVITGSDGKTSPPFTVTTKEWIIHWSYVPDTGLDEYGFGRHPTFFATINFRDNPHVSAAAIQYPTETEGTTYCYAGPGQYFLEVSANDLKSWEVLVSAA